MRIRIKRKHNWAVEQDDRSVLYFGNSAGLLQFDGNNWTNIAPDVFAYSMAKDTNGRIYLSQDNDFGYIGYNKKGQSIYVSLLKDQASSDEYLGTFYSTIVVNDSVYFLSIRGYLFTWANNMLTKTHLATSQPGKYKTLRYINYKFAFGSIQNGVLVTDNHGEILYNTNRSGGLQSNDHCAIFTDNRKNIWSGLENGISTIYANSPFTQLNEYANIPMAKTYSMLIHDNDFYIGLLIDYLRIIPASTI